MQKKVIMQKFAVSTLGCKLNFSESATIVRQFVENGYQEVDFKEEADIYIINTCSVTSMADKKSRYAIATAQKTNPDSIIAVIGCYAQLKPQEIAKIQGVDIVLGAKDKFLIFDYIKNIKKGEKLVMPCEIENIEIFNSAFSTDQRTRSFLKIQDGCDYFCAYCTIPMARGKSRNIEIKNILQQVKLIENKGIKEIVLTGINIGDFGKTTNETLFQLLAELENCTNIPRIRISSIEPNLLTDPIIQLVANSHKFLPHFHIPLQSGENTILAKMKRRYNTETFEDRIQKINTLITNAFIGVDVIVGFPGETDEIFEMNYNFIQRQEISFLHIFPYSDRENTASCKMTNKINSKVINLRTQILQELSNTKHNNFYNNNLSQKKKVLFETINQQKIYGFTENYIKVQAEADDKLLNQVAMVQLQENIKGKFVTAELLKDN